MSRHVIRLGDPTSHGGKVVGASSNLDMFGLPVARMGDPCTCPTKGHSGCTIAEGDPDWTIDGIPVALEGHKTSCGATLISTLGQVERRYDGDGYSPPLARAPNAPPGLDNAMPEEAKQHLQQKTHVEFQLVNQQDEPIPHQPYIVTAPDGRIFEGELDGDGCVRIEGLTPGLSRIEFPELGLSGTV